MNFSITFANYTAMHVTPLAIHKFKIFVATCLLSAGLAASFTVTAQTVPLAQAPMLTLKTAPGLVMLTMGRDLPLYKAAYNDVNDLDGDNIPDLFFKPAFRYEGYFAYDRCYNYAANVFTPSAYGNVVVPDVNDTSKNYYKCPGQWSGNFLNWVAMARIDVLRKVLYGGKRSTDTATTVLERTFVPQDSTMWGKEYRSLAIDGYLITDYTPLLQPNANTSHMFANTTLQNGNTADRTARYTVAVNNPVMIVYANRSGRIWDLVAQEAPILGANPTTANTAGYGNDPQPSATRGTVTQYVVRVSTCVLLSGKYEDWCTGYPVATPMSYKPTGLLHKYGEAKTLAFGLLSGSYDNNYAGGVLRQNIDDFNQEVVAANGRYNTAVNGIVAHLDKFRPWGFGGYDWGGNAFTRLSNNGEFVSWGNPLGEMMFESLKYFSGSAASTAYTTGVGTAANSPETPLALNRPPWANPYANSATRTNTTAYPKCARPIQMTIGDPKTSFDSDQLPGAAFAVGAGMGSNTAVTLAGLNVSTEADAIWASEFGAGVSKKFFVGEGLGNADGNPTSKTVSSFKNIRGHSPDVTTNQGSFYGASVARYGKQTGLINTSVSTTVPLRVDQISIALDSHVPQIKIPVNGKVISFVPISKSVNLLGISNAKGSYQQTGAITAFFVDEMANTNASNTNAARNGGRPYYKFRISFSDTDQGNDNESDAKVTYEVQVTAGNQLSVGMEYFNGSNGIEMHQGYVISGTTNDGLYLDVGGGGGFGVPPVPAVGYYLDTMPGQSPGSAMNAPATGPLYTNIVNRLPRSTLTVPTVPTALATPRLFTAGAATNGEFIPHDMLWYAAKYGSASQNADGSFSPKLKNPNDPLSDPENYYLVNNPSTLAAKMGDAFQKAASLAVASGTAVATDGTKIAGGALVYQAGFDSIKWGGELRAFAIDSNGNIANTPTWKATAALPPPASRTLVLGRGGNSQVNVTTTSYATLTGAEKTTLKDNATFQYLMGVRSSEKANNGTMRDRSSAIGDIVNSDPLFIGKADFGYTDTTYTAFKDTSNPQLVGVGSNDGSYRLLDSTSGVEKLAFFPNSVTSALTKLADPSYTHQYYVDGPSGHGHVKNGTAAAWKDVVAASLGAGGKTIFALDASTSNFATSGVLWELTSSNSGQAQYLGNVVNRPLIGQLQNDTGAVVLGNGINSIDDRASVMVINAQTGAAIRTCLPNSLANSGANGMSSIVNVSTANTGKIDLVYAADYQGNIWRIYPNDTNCSNTSVKVFSAKNIAGAPQPITGELTVINAPAGKNGYMILFGTGKYSSATDPANTAVQSMYGVWDDTNSIAGGLTRSNLLAYNIGPYDTSNMTRTIPKKADVNGGNAWYEPAASTLKGWVVDLTCTGCPVGERFVDKVTLVGSGPTSSQTAYFLTIVPSTDACQVGGGGWVTAVNPETGAYTQAFKNSTASSAYVGGVTPRGLFVVSKAATAATGSTAAAPGADYLYVTRNFSSGSSNAADSAVSPVFNEKAGGTTNGNDGSGTTSLGTEIPCTGSGCAAPVTSSGTRRQVWRQIQ